MTYEIYATHNLSLSQVQTISAIILSVLGFGWFIFLSNVVKIKVFWALRQSNNGDNEIPVLEAMVPITIMETARMLKKNIKRLKPVLLISAMVIFGLVLTSFEGIIVINTVHYVESCKTITVISPAQIVNDNNPPATSSVSEVEAMMYKRNKSGVPDDILVGQIPIDERWKFNAQLDVDPYPCRSSCSLYKSGVTQVNINGSAVDWQEKFPEIHAEYTFRNSTDGYNFTDFSRESSGYFNLTKGENITSFNGYLAALIEEFTQGSFDTVGAKYMNRIWTLRVPETTRMPYDQNNNTIIGIQSVPMVVEAYTCEIERVKEGNHGCYNGLSGQDIDITLSVMYATIKRKWTLAVVNGKDTSIYKLTPEHWTSYLAVRDTQTAQVEEVPVQIDISCFKIHSAYILLLSVYVIMTLIGCICWVIIYRSKLRVPSGEFGWANQACREADRDKAEHNLSDYNLVADGEKIKIRRNEN